MMRFIKNSIKVLKKSRKPWKNHAFRGYEENGDDGIRTHVPVARQLDFESSSL